MEKKELIEKIKDILTTHGGLLMPDVTIEFGDVHTIEYIEICDSVEVNVISGIGNDIMNPETVTIDVDFLGELDLKKILEAINNE